MDLGAAFVGPHRTKVRRAPAVPLLALLAFGFGEAPFLFCQLLLALDVAAHTRSMRPDARSGVDGAFEFAVSEDHRAPKRRPGPGTVVVRCLLERAVER